jgi:hypothetical protein
MLNRELDERIVELCDGRQEEYYRLFCAGNSFRQIGKQLERDESSVRGSLKKLEKRVAALGVVQNYTDEKGVAPGYKIKGTSSLIGADGQKKLEWVKTCEDTQKAEDRLKMMIEALIEQTPIKKGKVKAPALHNADLMACIPIGDPHLGMYAWAEECGEDFDCEIAEDRTIKAVDRIVDAMPSCGVCRIEELGDMFHSDTEDATTRRSGNHLDVDGRWGRVVKIALRMMTHCVDRCLEKHEKVEVICVKGNHDDQTAYCMAMMLDLYYRAEPRVWVDTHYGDFHFKEFGKVLLGANHGMIKPDKLHTVMTCDMAEAWGRTLFRYWHVGHIHHHRSIEIGGCIVEAFRTLASKEAYSTAAGHRSGRDLSGIVYHKDFGEIERHKVNIAMLNAED